MNALKKILLTIVLLGTVVPLSAQVTDPVRWKAEIEKTGNLTYNLVIHAEIEEGWHLYSQNQYGDNGPLPTAFTFSGTGENYELTGKTREEKGVEKYDEVFGINIKYFENTATFVQKIKISSGNLQEIRGEVFYMVCSGEQCLPPETREFSFSVPR